MKALSQPAAGQIKVLIVDDDPLVLETLDDLLRGEGYETVIAMSGMQALDLAARERPSVVLLDVILPDMDGFEVCRRIKNDPGTQFLQVILVTGLSGAEQRVNGAKVGADDFITKPPDEQELLTRIKSLARIHDLQTELAGLGSTPARVERAAERLVVFCAFKGGTGRTMLALNTAVSLHKRSGKPVVLMDADYTLPALDVALNLRSDLTVADLLARQSYLDEDLLSGVLAAHASGVKVLLAPPPGHDGSHLVSLPQVQEILAVLKRMFPWVVVDLGLPLDEAAYAFLDEADRILVSVVPEMVALRNTRRLVDQLNLRGYPEDKVWLVLNRATIRGGVSKADIEGRLRMNAALTYLVPDDQALVTLSINRGIPLVLSHGRSDVGRAIDQLAQRLIDDLPGPETVEPGAAPGRRRGRSRR